MRIVTSLEDARVQRRWRKRAQSKLRAELKICGVPHDVAESLVASSADFVHALSTLESGELANETLRIAARAFTPIVEVHPYIDFRLWGSTLGRFTQAVGDDRWPARDEWEAASRHAGEQALQAPIPYRGLQLARDHIGKDRLLDVFRLGEKIVRLTPHYARYAIYASQSFFEPQKVQRALNGVGLDEPLPASIVVREQDGYIYFVLADGHHRALVRNYRDIPIFLRPHPDQEVKQHYSFRNYVKEHWQKL